MFLRVWEFVKRHKKKFITTGVILIGGRYGYRYLRDRVHEFQEKEAADCLAHARRQHHFDTNQRTCNMTVLSMLPTLRERLMVLLNTEKITELLKTSPTNKIQLWDDLKILSVTRVVSVVYGCTMMCIMLRVQLNIIGGYMYIDNVQQHKGKSLNSEVAITPTEVQEKYLTLITEFLEKGVADLTEVVQQAVVKEATSLSLKEKLSYSNLEAIFTHIRERIETGGESSETSIPTMPLSKLLLPSCTTVADSSAESDAYKKLLQETQDILESSDFHSVFATGLNRGFAKLMDYIADFYKQIQRTDTSCSSFHEVCVPIAKLIPFLSGLLHKLGSDAPNPLVQELLLLDQTKTLAANIYEAFSQLDDPEDDAQFSP